MTKPIIITRMQTKGSVPMILVIRYREFPGLKVYLKTILHKANSAKNTGINFRIKAMRFRLNLDAKKAKVAVPKQII